MGKRRSSLPPITLVVLLTLGFGSHAHAQLVAPPNDSVLHVFGSGDDGIGPVGGVIFDSAGNLYGVTEGGGVTSGCFTYNSCGTVYELSPSANSGGAWTETILYRFTGTPNDGELPSGGLITDASGNLYGVTSYGGTGNCRVLGSLTGCGTVFELSPPSQPGGTWTETVLYSFQSGNDGYAPVGTLAVDENGNLYGATYYGGGFGVCNAPFYPYCGTIFELSPPTERGGAWSEQVLYSFKGGAGDGANPNGSLTLSENGVLFGTTNFGGDQSNLCGGGENTGCGTVFELEPSFAPTTTWTETVLYKFLDTPDGASPTGGLLIGSGGSLYGTAFGGGGNQGGSVFKVSPPRKAGDSWIETPIFNFDGTTGEEPEAGLIMRNEILYGTVSIAGPYRTGAVYQLSRSTTDRADPSVALTVLCYFPPGNQVWGPWSTLTFDKSGNLYGTSEGYNREVNGAVFKIAP